VNHTREDDLLWYVSYGSNMSAARFACYLRGGRPVGGARTYPGARDPRPARDTRGVWLPGAVYFAGESAVWTGGMAFYDPDAAGRAAARAYLVSAGQFADVAAQEMYRAPGADLDLSEVLATGRSLTGPGRYETLVRAGELDGRPLLTFTAPTCRAQSAPASPSAAYLSMLAGGLREAHGWDCATIAGYLSGLSGARGVWALPALEALCEAGLGDNFSDRH